jgi:GMP synthase (glutamine-hydrolysing)
MKILLIDNNTKHIEDWRLLANQAGYELDIAPYANPTSENEVDVIILSGGRNLAVPDNREAFKNEIELIKTTDKLLIGVCLGFELIADTFGAELLHRPERVSGTNEVRVTKPHPMFGSLQTFTAQEAHKFYVDSVKGELEEYARSDSGVEVLKHKSKSIYGFQFHPEIVTEGNQGTEILLNLLKSS